MLFAKQTIRKCLSRKYYFLACYVQTETLMCIWEGGIWGLSCIEKEALIKPDKSQTTEDYTINLY